MGRSGDAPAQEAAREIPRQTARAEQAPPLQPDLAGGVGCWSFGVWSTLAVEILRFAQDDALF